MSNDKTGGPAFPSPGIGLRNDETKYQRDGMTLWDWYAGQVLCGLMAYPGGAVIDMSVVADYADSMIAERKKRGLA